MQRILLAAALAVALPSIACAQTADSTHNPAIKDPTVQTTTDTAAGRNSFTQHQAQTRISNAGYSHVGKLVKDENGIWQGTAMKDGKSVMVALDYKGDVTAR